MLAPGKCWSSLWKRVTKCRDEHNNGCQRWVALVALNGAQKIETTSLGTEGNDLGAIGKGKGGGALLGQ